MDVAGAARVAARGGTTGGSIRIGGDAHGSGPLRRATAVRIDAGAELAADGAARGGRIVAWSDGLTEVDGTLSARGAGGFVETSGRVALAIGAAAKVSAARWLLDPQDILIADGPGGPLPGGALVVSRIALEAALNGGADVTVTTSAPPDAEMPGDITVAVPLGWTGTGDLRLEAARDIAINAAVTTRDGNFTADAGRWLAVAADVTRDRRRLGRPRRPGGPAHRPRRRRSRGDHRARRSHHHAAPTASSSAGPTRALAASRSAPPPATSRSPRAGGSSSAAARWPASGCGSAPSSSASAVRIASERIEVLAGDSTGSFAEVVTGAGGGLDLQAGVIVVRDRPGAATARIAALNGAPLTLAAEEQIWNGSVEAGSGLADGGDVRLSGAITAFVAPNFSLGAGADFLLAARGAGRRPLLLRLGPAARRHDLGHRHGRDRGPDHRRAGRAGLGRAGPARRPAPRVTATGSGDALVISAGRRFENAAGAGALAAAAPDARWLLYVDRFDGVTGALPGPRGFDLYGRALANAAPADLGFDGNRLIYAERPTLTLTAASLRKTYGTAATPGFSTDGLRSGDSLATAFAIAPEVTSTGAGAGSAAGAHTTRVIAAASRQGYAVEVVDGRLTVDKAALVVRAADASRRYGAADPGFTAAYSGFVLGDGADDLGGTLGFTTPAGRASAVGRYGLTPRGLTSGNYAISYAPGTLTIERAPLTVTPAFAARSYGADTPAFAARYAGFVLGEGAGDLAAARLRHRRRTPEPGRPLPRHRLRPRQRQLRHPLPPRRARGHGRRR